MAGVKRPRPRDAPLSLGVAVEGPGVAARAVRCGVEHLAVLLEGGGLLVWALHRRGAVSSALSGGLHEGLGKVHTIRGLDLRDVACGWGHSAAVVRSGEVVAWGLDAYGEPASAPGVRVRAEAMGHASNPGYLDMDVRGWRPALLSFEKSPVERVACGWSFVCALTAGGEVWQWGQTGAGRPDWGLGAVPREVTGLPVAVNAVACGSGHVMAIGAGGELFGWGDNKFGQLGVGSSAPAVSSPARVAGELEGRRVVHVACSQHTVAVADDGGLFTWGCGSRWQLGHGRKRNLPQPKRVLAMEAHRCTRAHCGVYHTVTETDGGGAYFWGSGVFGDGGDYSWDEAPQPHLLGERIGRVSCGGIQTVFLSAASEGSERQEFGEGGEGSQRPPGAGGVPEVEMFRQGMRKVIIRAKKCTSAGASPLQAVGAGTPRQRYEMLASEVGRLDELATFSGQPAGGKVTPVSGEAPPGALARKPRKRSKSGDGAADEKRRARGKGAQGKTGPSKRKHRRKPRKNCPEEVSSQVSSQVSSCPAGAPIPPVLHFQNSSSEEAVGADGGRGTSAPSSPEAASAQAATREVQNAPTAAEANQAGEGTDAEDAAILSYWTAVPPPSPALGRKQEITAPLSTPRVERAATPEFLGGETSTEGFQSPVLNWKLKEMTAAIRDMLITHQAAELGSEPRPMRAPSPSERKCDASAQTPSRSTPPQARRPSFSVISRGFPEEGGEEAYAAELNAGTPSASSDSLGAQFVFQNPMAAAAPSGPYSQVSATPSSESGSLAGDAPAIGNTQDIEVTKNPMAAPPAAAAEPAEGGQVGPASQLRSQNSSRRLSSGSPAHLEPRVQRLELPPMTGSIHDFIAQMEATLTAGTPSAAPASQALALHGASESPTGPPSDQGRALTQSSSPSKRSSLSTFEGGVGGASLASLATTVSQSHDGGGKATSTGAPTSPPALSDVSKALLSGSLLSGVKPGRDETPEVTPQKFTDWNAVLTRFGAGTSMPEEISERRTGAEGMPLDHLLSMANECMEGRARPQELPRDGSLPMEVYLETLSTQVEALILEVKTELKSKRGSPAKTSPDMRGPGSGVALSQRFRDSPEEPPGLSGYIEREIGNERLNQSVQDYATAVSDYVAVVAERQSADPGPAVSRAQARQALESLFARIAGEEDPDGLLQLLEETAAEVNFCQDEMNQALGHLETLCALDHVDEAAEAQAQAEVSHLRTKQSSLRQMYEIVVLKLSDDSETDVDGGSPGLSLPRAGDIAKRSTSDSEASAELDAAACAVEILQQRETVNELLLRFT